MRARIKMRIAPQLHRTREHPNGACAETASREGAIARARYFCGPTRSDIGDTSEVHVLARHPSFQPSSIVASTDSWS